MSTETQEQSSATAQENSQRNAAVIAQLLRDADAEIEVFTQLQQSLREELTLAMVAEGMTEIITPDGQGYRRQQESTTVFADAVYGYLREEGLEDLFRPAPKVTATTLDKLRKELLLSEDQVNGISQFKQVSMSGSWTLRKFTPKPSRSFIDSEIKRMKEAPQAAAAAEEIVITSF